MLGRGSTNARWRQWRPPWSSRSWTPTPPLRHPMKVLVATAIYPTAEFPRLGTFVHTQVEYLKRAGIAIELMVLQGRSRKLMYPRAVLELRRRLAGQSIDLVHAHYGFVGMIARMQWKVPVIVSFCGDDILGTVDDRGRLTTFGKVVARAGQLLGNYVDAVVVKSQEMASKLKRMDNVYVIPHEIDFDVFQPVEKQKARAILGLDSNKKYLLFAANPGIPVKRFPLAKAIADEMKRTDPSIELLVVYQEPQDRLALFMSACDALTFTSFQEGSPNIVKQAMACNLPIVSTDVGDVRQVIGSTEGCYVCPPDVFAFTQKLSQVLRANERTRGREQVGHLAGPLVAQRLIQVYERTLARRRDARLVAPFQERKA
jgi:teichuronic acid biosynthesis glycosyltransferase TuaC